MSDLEDVLEPDIESVFALLFEVDFIGINNK